MTKEELKKLLSNDKYVDSEFIDNLMEDVNKVKKVSEQMLYPQLLDINELFETVKE